MKTEACYHLRKQTSFGAWIENLAASTGLFRRHHFASSRPMDTDLSVLRPNLQTKPPVFRGLPQSVFSGIPKVRRWHARLYQVLSIALTPLYQSNSLIYPVLRDIGAGSFAKIPTLPWLLAKLIPGQLLLARNPILPRRRAE